MKAEIFDLSNKVVGEIDLNEEIFALEPRADIVKLVIEWQTARSRLGTHSVKTVSDVSGTTRKPFKQKGTGNARQGSLRSVHMRGGGVSHGPVNRSHATKLPKKIRKLGLRHALSTKMLEGKLIILDSLNMEQAKSGVLKKTLKNFSAKSFFVISGQVEKNFYLASQNLHNINCVPQIGANVYDIIKHDYLLLSKEAIPFLEERLK